MASLHTSSSCQSPFVLIFLLINYIAMINSKGLNALPLFKPILTRQLSPIHVQPILLPLFSHTLFPQSSLKAVLYGEVWQAKRNVGRPHLRYMDCTKRHLLVADINKRHWEEMAHDRSAWRTAVKKEATKVETKTATDAKIKRQRRHERALAFANRINQQLEFACLYCGRTLSARIGQLSHERDFARKRSTICDVILI